MKDKIEFIFRFIKSTIYSNGFYSNHSNQINKLAKKCIENVDKMERKDILDIHFEPIVAYILGAFSSVISYQESISFLCLSGHGLNSTILLRTQLEAYLIFSYLINEKQDLNSTEKKVEEYKDWVMVRMYKNSLKSKGLDLFQVNPEHSEYLNKVKENYFFVKSKYENNTNEFKRIENSQSFLKNKREIAKKCEIEDLYLGIFSETSATVHLADISDRMSKYSTSDFDGYEYKFSSNQESMMVSGVSNILLTKAINDFSEYFELPEDLMKKLSKKIEI